MAQPLIVSYWQDRTSECTWLVRCRIITFKPFLFCFNPIYPYLSSCFQHRLRATRTPPSAFLCQLSLLSLAATVLLLVWCQENSALSFHSYQLEFCLFADSRLARLPRTSFCCFYMSSSLDELRERIGNVRFSFL